MPRRRKAVPSAGRQGGPRLQIGTRIPKSLRQRVRLYCVEHDCRMDHFVAEAIREYLRHRQRE